MNQHITAFILCLLCATAARAIQPVETGLEPLYQRLQQISGEQQLLNQKLQAAETIPRDRALAYRRYQVLEDERLQLTREIAQAKELARSPLVTFMASGSNGK